MIDSATASGWGVAAAAFGAAVFERMKSAKVETKTIEDKSVVSEAKAWEARATLYKKMADDSQVLLEKEYTAHEATRAYHHEKAAKDQAALFTCNQRVLELQNKTDISHVEEILADNQKVLMSIGEGIQKLLMKP